MYFYDEEGSPIAVEYREPSYSATQYDVFTLVKNLQGDITAVYNENGVLVGEYIFNAYGVVYGVTLGPNAT